MNITVCTMKYASGHLKSTILQLNGLVHHYNSRLRVDVRGAGMPTHLSRVTPHPVHPLCEGGLCTHAWFPHRWVLCHHFFEGLELAVEASRPHQWLRGCALRVIRPRKTRVGWAFFVPCIVSTFTNDYDGNLNGNRHARVAISGRLEGKRRVRDRSQPERVTFGKRGSPARAPAPPHSTPAASDGLGVEC